MLPVLFVHILKKGVTSGFYYASSIASVHKAVCVAIYTRSDFVTCSRPPLKPTWLKWLLKNILGFSDVSRANSSQQKTGTSCSACILLWSSTALTSIRNFSTSRRAYSSSPPWNTWSHTLCLSSKLSASAAACHWEHTQPDTHNQKILCNMMFVDIDINIALSLL